MPSIRNYRLNGIILLFTLFVICFCLSANAEPSASTNYTLRKFSASVMPIPPEIQAKMRQYTWQPTCPTPLSGLSYVQLTYYGFDGKAHNGVLIVNRKLARQIVAIFRKLYQQRFPIARMQPVYVFHGNDERSMQANNTSAFNCRFKTGSQTRFSWHAYGRAIDINPMLNPYVKGNIVLPKNARTFINRRQNYRGLIKANGIVTKTFAHYGWRWGGSWRYRKDFQHFEKPADR